MKERFKKIVEYEKVSFEVKIFLVISGIIFIISYFVVSLWNHSFTSYHGAYPSIVLLFTSLFCWIVLIISKLTKRKVYWEKE
jgi:uncharacterized membrane protein